MNTSPNAYQNAGQNGSFYNVNIANQASSFLALILALILLVALLRSEKRYRELKEKI